MKAKLSAIIFSKNCSEYNVDEIKTVNFFKLEETSFDISLYDSSENVLEKLYDNRGFDCIITIGNIDDFPELFTLPFLFRRKWVHFEEYDPELIADSIVSTFKTNINRPNDDSPLFSIFTCGYQTKKEWVLRLYNSLLAQTYDNWNWWIIDDNPDDFDSYFNHIKDPRINIIKNVTSHGNIGYNKHMIAMCCDGDYLVEMDHDDEITEDCLQMLKNAFDKYPDCDFVYSYAIEEMDGEIVNYGENFSLGLGKNAVFEFNGKETLVPCSPDVNVLSMRHIVAMPNHVRCWRKDFYHRIGGHNIEISILDDMDIIIRTFLNGKMCKIPKFLYIQHEGSSLVNDRGDTTQSKRYLEIVRIGRVLKDKYDIDIKEFAERNGVEDPYWDDELGYSLILNGPKEGTVNFNYIY